MFKDVLKRIVVVVLILGAVVFAIEFFSKMYGKNELHDFNNTNETKENEVVNEEVIPEVIEKETDEIETYDLKKARVNDVLNLRAEPNTNSTIIDKIQREEIIDVKAKIRNGWYKVERNGITGYVSGEYITILNEEEMKEITIEEEYTTDTFATVNIDTELNIRSRANKEGEIVTIVLPKSVLKVFSKMQNGWYKVEGNNVTGFVSGEYIKLLTIEEYNSLSSSENNMINPGENIIATYTATGSYNENSRFNMQKAAGYINGTVVEPGKTYSHLETIHPTGEEGYVSSTVFVDGKVTQGIGGGICLTSSTLYASIASATEKGINTGLIVSARREHSIPVGYVPRRYEATVSTGSQDFCFRNCNNYAVRIDATYSGNTLTINIVKL